MRADIVTHPRFGPGHGLIRLPEGTAAPTAAAVQRNQGPDMWLGPDGWQGSEHRFPVAAASMTAAAMTDGGTPVLLDADGGRPALGVGPAVVEPLLAARAGSAAFALHLFDGEARTTRALSVRDLLGSNARRAAAAAPVEPKPEPAAVEEPAPEPAAEKVEITVDPVAKEPPPRAAGPNVGLIAAGVALLLAAGGGAAWFLTRGGDAPPAVVQAPAKPVDVRKEVAEYLATTPAPEAAAAKAGAMAAAGRLDGAMLVYRYAAEKGNGPAALALARMYDPATFTPQTSPLPAPNAETARTWYQAAAATGDAEAAKRAAALGGK